MFDFEYLEVYKKSSHLNREVLSLLRDNIKINYCVRDQMLKASISIVLNIAEGSGKLTIPGKRNFYTIARGSVYECVAVLDIMFAEKYVSQTQYNYFYKKFEEISKMLYALIRSNC